MLPSVGDKTLSRGFVLSQSTFHLVFNVVVADLLRVYGRTRRASWCPRHRLRLRRRLTRPVTLSRAASSGNCARWPRTTPTWHSTSWHSSSATATGRPSRLGAPWRCGRPSSSGWTTTCGVGRLRCGTSPSERPGRTSATPAAATSCTRCDNFVFRPGSTISFSSWTRSEIGSDPLSDPIYSAALWSVNSHNFFSAVVDVVVHRNVWQSLACSPRGIAVTPSGVYVKQNWVVIPLKTQYWSPQGLAVKRT